MEKRVFIRGKEHDIPVVITYPENGRKPYPLVLMLHGHLSFKEGDGYMFRIGAERLANEGIASARFDFCSMGENRFSRRNYGMKVMLEETACVFEYLCQDPLIDPARIGIMGHSLGGRVALSSAFLPSKCLITLNGVINMDGDVAFIQNYDHAFMKQNGYILKEMSDGRTELLFQSSIDEITTYHSSAVDLYQNPILVCIGKADPTIDPNVSYDFVKTAKEKHIQVDVIEIDDANHSFNAKTGDYTKLHALYDQMIVWLKEHL